MDRSLVNQILPSTGAYGEAFEHFIICEIVKLVHLNILAQYKLFFLRTRLESEIDLIVERPNSSNLCIEIKSSEDVSEEYIKKLEQFQKDMPSDQFMIFSKEPRTRKVRNITIYPWQEGIKKYFMT